MTMPDETTQNTGEKPELAQEELDRGAPSRVYANVAAPVNAAVAANVLADDSTGYADAE
jgi:hypothetical protein